MSNIKTISYYEKLHDIFERVSPKEMPLKLDKLVSYLKEGAQSYEQQTGDEMDVFTSISILGEMKTAFTNALVRTNKSMILSHEDRKYEVNIYPIRDFLEDNQTIVGDLSDLKITMVLLVNEKNIGLFKQNYTFVEDLTMILAED